MARLLNYAAFYEPVETNPYLEDFYRDPKRYALEMQWWFLSHRFRMHQEAIEHIWNTGQSVIMDRSIYGDAIFAKKNWLDGNISDLGYETYLKHRNMMIESKFLLVPHLTIYLESSPEVCQYRIEKIRKRDCENGIPIEYLKGLDDLYQELMIEMKQRGSNVVSINNDPFVTAEEVIDQLQLSPYSIATGLRTSLSCPQNTEREAASIGIGY